VRYFIKIHKLQTELGVFETGVKLILEHGVESLGYHIVRTGSLYLTWAPIGTEMWHQDRQTDRKTELPQLKRAIAMLALAHENVDW